MSLHDYIRQKHVEAANTLAATRKIYLDIRYWIIVRQTALGQRTSPAEQKLLAELRKGVQERRFICPISDATFFEWLKQADSTSRARTAQLIDELSLGYALAAIDARVLDEMREMLLGASGTKRTDPALVWTRASNVVGMAPLDDALLALVPLHVQQNGYDQMWAMSLAEIQRALGPNLAPFTGFSEAFAAQVTHDAAQHRHQIRSFKQAYVAEVEGVASFFAQILAPALLDDGWPLDATEMDPLSRQDRAQRTLARLAYGALVSDNLVLPTLRTLASLHAALRWDKARPFRKNDFLDIQHAAGAVAYCDAFLTEGPLISLMQSKNMRLPRRDALKSAAAIDEAIDLVETLA